MRVRFLADWAGPQHSFQPAGTELEVDEATAQLLLHGGIAEPLATETREAAISGPPAVAAHIQRPTRRTRKRR